MKFQLNYLLWLALVVLGILYGYGTIYSNSPINELNDLWANLFASLIVILVLEYIVKKSRDEEIKPTESYVKKKLAHTLTDLIMYVAPDSDWKNLLEATLDWRDYFPLFPDMRKMAIVELTQILQNPDYIINDKFSKENQH